jgi:hypothetical protein
MDVCHISLRVVERNASEHRWRIAECLLTFDDNFRRILHSTFAYKFDHL